MYRGHSNCLFCESEKYLILGHELVQKIIYLRFDTDAYDLMLENSKVCIKCIGRLQQIHDFCSIRCLDVIEDIPEGSQKICCNLCRHLFASYELVPLVIDTKETFDGFEGNKWMDASPSPTTCCFSCYNFLISYNEIKQLLDTMNEGFYAALDRCKVIVDRSTQQDISDLESSLLNRSLKQNTNEADLDSTNARQENFFDSLLLAPILKGKTSTPSPTETSKKSVSFKEIRTIRRFRNNKAHDEDDTVICQKIENDKNPQVRECSVIVEKLPIKMFENYLLESDSGECIAEPKIKSKKKPQKTLRIKINRRSKAIKRTKVAQKDIEKKTEKIKNSTKSTVVDDHKIKKHSKKTKSSKISNMDSIQSNQTSLREENNNDSLVISGDLNENATKSNFVKNVTVDMEEDDLRNLKVELEDVPMEMGVPDATEINYVNFYDNSQAPESASETSYLNTSTKIEFLNPQYKTKDAILQTSIKQEELDVQALPQKSASLHIETALSNVDINNSEYYDNVESIEELLASQPNQNHGLFPIYSMDDLLNEDSLLISP